MTENAYFSKFKFTEKFDRLPVEMAIDGRGELRLDQTKIDMIPFGLKGVSFVFLRKKPRYVAPDFEGIIMYYNSDHSIKDMPKEEVEAAKDRYITNREMVEKPRYIENEDGTLSICSLPSDMRIFRKPFESGYYLDLTRTSISEKQNLDGFKDSILYPKRSVQQELFLYFPRKICSHTGHQTTDKKTKIYE